MYAVVGCSECSALWIIEGRTETTQCPRCGSRRPYERRRKFVETADQDHAREVRASMLASRSGHGEAFAELDSVAELDRQLEDAGVDDETYLAASGLDPEEIERAGERSGPGGGRSESRRETVDRLLREHDEPTLEELAAAGERSGLDAADVERIVEKLVRAGEVTESDGRYRPL